MDIFDHVQSQNHNDAAVSLYEVKKKHFKTSMLFSG